MHRFIRVISILLSSLLVLSCGSNDPLEDEHYYLNVTPTTINASAEGGNFDLHYSTGYSGGYLPNKIKFDTDSDFITCGGYSYEPDSNHPLYVYPNNTGSARIGTVTVSSTDCPSVTVTVLQQAANGGGGSGGSGNGGGSGGGGSTSKPSAPSGLSAYWDGPASYPYVVLSWNSVSNATSYLVYRSTSANGSYSKIGDSNYSSYSDNNVSIGKTYYYKVKASNSAGQSDYSNYVSVTLEDTRKPGPVTYGNCTATSTSITLRWTIPTDPSYGKPTKIVLRLYDPTYKTWVDAQELSGTATSVTFSFGMWIDSYGYVKCGVIPYNDYGSGGGSAKVYDTKNKKWIN